MPGKTSGTFKISHSAVQLIFFVFLLLSPSQAATAAGKINLVNYNIGRGGTLQLPGRKHWDSAFKLRVLSARLRGYRNVVVGLQEVDDCSRRTSGAKQVDVLLNRLPASVTAHYLPKRSIKKGAGCPVASSGIAVLTDGKVLKVAYPLKANQNHGGGALALKLKIDDVVFWFVNVHLSTERATIKNDIKILVQWIANNVASKTPLVIAGDFNVFKDGCHRKRGCSEMEKRVYQQMHRPLKKAGLSDVSGDIMTFKPWQPLSHIDYIYIRRCKKENLRRLFAKGKGISDHVGLTAGLACTSN